MDSAVYNIAIAFDQNYLHPIYALVTSILRHNAGSKLHFHAIATGISVHEKEKLRNYIELTGGKLSFYDVNEELVRKFVLTNNKWSPAVYYRLFFPLLISEDIRRLLYLDSDTIVINDLYELYTLDLGHHPVAAVYDNYVKVQPLLSIHEPGEYFNSGVLLLDIKRWKEQKISEQAIDYIMKHPDRLQFVDQCALNGVLHNNWKKIDSRYNLLYSYIPESISKKGLAFFLKSKVVVHFTIQRPWNMLCKNRLRYLYHHYLSQAPVAQRRQKYVDFAWSKIPAWIGIRVSEFYFDHPLIQQVWRKSKRQQK